MASLKILAVIMRYVKALMFFQERMKNIMFIKKQMHI